ncbi:hypothetical protein QBC47DRAFT_80661 [Echria macrotheca]|uniref:Uncharacterized protein n=1 Tax=Echria macrotheca TaxID=438768 RepID=A0AAJ0B445_9PEZI|nr:hypothetical protein QBC47DRAFT_80661 [Echria macrotheca]
MTTLDVTQEPRSPMPVLTSPDQLLAPCPKFRILVLGNPESTKQELFSKVFGVDLEKRLVSEGFTDDHNIEEELNLEGQNDRLTIYTSPNFGSDNEDIYRRVCNFISSRDDESRPLRERIHCIWYCVASEEERPISRLEARFFGEDIASVAPHVPVIMVFTKYDEFISKVQLDWSKDAQERGLSKVAVTHILNDLTAKRFSKTIGKRWDELMLDKSGRPKGKRVLRACVAGGTDPDDDESSFEALATTTLESLREWKEGYVRLVFAAAQRNSATISTKYCAKVAADYFSVNTGHARKADGMDVSEILPNFWAKAVNIFNMRDVSCVLSNPGLLERVLFATFEKDQRPLLEESLHRSSTDQTILLGLSPHERAVLLTQELASIVMFLDKLADMQWPQRDPFGTVTAYSIESDLRAIAVGRGKRELLETIEGSTIFTTSPLKQAIADLITRAVEQADKAVSPHGRGAGRAIVVVDDSELQEMSLTYVNDKAPDDMVLPCGLTILPLN